MAKKTDAQKAARIVRNTIKRERGYKTTLPDGTKVPAEMINEQIEIDVMSNYTQMYNEYVPKSGKVYMQPEGRQRGKSQKSEKGKTKVSEQTVAFIREQTKAKESLLALPTPDEFNKMSEEERAPHYLELEAYKKNYDYTMPSYKKWKADAEVIRSRLLNSTKIPLEVRRFLAKADLQTVMDFVEFMNKAKNDTSIPFEDSDQLLDKYYSAQYEDRAVLGKTTGAQILANFLRYQISKPYDAEYTNKLIRKAASIKVRGKHIFTYDELEGYL